MIGKPWDQLSTEEKLERLRQQIAELFGQADINRLLANQQIGKLREQVESLEKRLDQGDTEAAGHQPDES
jgi:hypothetical protein